MEIFQLRAGTLQVTMVKEQLQPSQNSLGRGIEKRNDVRRAQESMACYQHYDFQIATGDCERMNKARARETREARCLCGAIEHRWWKNRFVALLDFEAAHFGRIHRSNFVSMIFLLT